MKYKVTTPEEYLAQIPEDRKEAFQKLRKVIKRNLPEGFKEGMSYGMIGYYVPHSIYPKGYHVSPELPLPFIHIASQKNTVNLYHNGIYASKDLFNWFVDAYKQKMSKKPDMGKSCVRFKKMNEIPYDLIGELCRKMTVLEWVERYEENLKK